MRNPFTGAIAGLAVLILSSIAMTQPQQGTYEAPLWKYDGRNRSAGPGGPAPVHDLSGSWAGPRSGAGVPDSKPGDVPSMTPLGQKLFSANKSLQKYNPAGTNDPVVRTCDPLGFPRADKYSIMEMAFATMPDRIVVLYPFQQQWREIWMDGRELPRNVGATEKGAPDPRYYGYSVGHWEGDTTLVVNTTGLDDRTWLTEAGYPHSIDAQVQEHFTRTDHNDLELTLTIDDPKLYTKPFSLGTEYFRWVPNQFLEERLCIPSQVVEYLKAVGDPAGKP
ncbi:MAG: hypothetical protein DMG30_05645 [Acidobacteria bacterium]|nr:MAG: hypothetical protein DMG30_05645 [Acidobacteriota bacterium]